MKEKEGVDINRLTPDQKEGLISLIAICCLIGIAEKIKFWGSISLILLIIIGIACS